jgi:hypothetical protein
LVLLGLLILYQHEIFFDENGYWVSGVAHVRDAVVPEVLEQVGYVVLEELAHRFHLLVFLLRGLVWNAVVVILGKALQ